MNKHLVNLLSQLSDEDKQAFVALSDRLKEVAGDMSRLTDTDFELIKLMEKKYSQAINQTVAGESLASNELQVEKISEDSILSMPFTDYVRQTLARDLSQRFPQEEDAIQFAFDSKWLPLDLQENSLIEDVYQRFEADIIEINQWRKDLVTIESDKKMALGLAWFMVIFQLKKRFVD